jgi:diguanylate cyclase
MISIKKYLDAKNSGLRPEAAGLLAVALAAYRAALAQMAHSSTNACPGLGTAFSEQLLGQVRALNEEMGEEQMAHSGHHICQQLEQWGVDAARHYQEKSDEVKELLLAMLKTADGVGTRDQRTAGQIHEVTERLKAVASLDDLTQIRASIQSSAALLKSSIDRMTEEGQAAVAQLRGQVNNYQTKLEEAEKLALRDSLTGLLNRLCVEKQIERRVAAGAEFCVAVIDINSFKQVNDTYGHLAGDELLKQFASELTSASRSSDIVGRWGGDEFVIVFDGSEKDAATQVERLEKWVCGNYTLTSPSGSVTLPVQASMGLAAHQHGEKMKELLARADKDMYGKKPSAAAR